MIKLLIFDLDGIFVNKDIHFQSLNLALAQYSDIQLTYEEHEKYYDGRPTIQKLKLLENNKGLDHKLSDKIWVAKQNQTRILIANLEPDKKYIEMLQNFRQNGYKLSLASNAIEDTVEKSLLNLGIRDYLEPRISNEDVKLTKPYPECYWKCMTYWRALPKQTLIIEDSPVGIQGAHDSGAHVYECISQDYLDYQKIKDYINVCSNL